MIPRIVLLAAALAATVAFGGCLSPLIGENEFAGKSALQQEALTDSLNEAVIKLLPRPEKEKDEDEPENTVKVEVKRQNIVAELRGRDVALKCHVLSRGAGGTDAENDAALICSAMKVFLIQHVEARVVPEDECEIVLIVRAHQFGVNISARYFPLQVLSAFAAVSVEAVTELDVFAFHRKTNRPLYMKKVKASKQYDRYSLLGFEF